MMHRMPAERSLRRSHVRARLLSILATRGTVHSSHLIDLASIDTRRLGWAMFGDGDRYRRDLSLVGLRLVEQIRRGTETHYRATPAGRRFARRLMRERRMRQWT